MATALPPHILVSGILSILTRSASAPFERVKLLLQCQNELLRSGRITQPYSGIVNCASHLIFSEGISSFWRGNWVHILGVLPSQVFTSLLRNPIKKLFYVDQVRHGFLAFYTGNDRLYLFFLFFFFLIRSSISASKRVVWSSSRRFITSFDISV